MAEWKCEHGVWHSNWDRIDPCEACRKRLSNMIRSIMVQPDETDKPDDVDPGGVGGGRLMRLIECPIAGVNKIEVGRANELLCRWGHKLGPINRPFLMEAFALEVEGEPVAVAVSASIVHGPVAGYVTQEVVELARLAASNSWANRVMLRLWREVCAPRYAAWTPKAAVSYSHNTLHSGDLYRFDGWVKVSDRKGSTGNGGNWGRRGKGYANETIHGLKTLWVYEYVESGKLVEAN